MKRIDILRRTGSVEQIFGCKRYMLLDGVAKGGEAVDIYNQSGLELQVLIDRGMDISKVRYKGINIGFLSKVGIPGPWYFSEDGTRGFLRNFYVGFLTTCGLTYMGSACTDQGIPLGLHGRVSNLPAENHSHQISWEGDSARLIVSGDVRQAEVFGENMVLHRKITVPSDRNEIILEDSVENMGMRSEPFMMLYHMNYGFPFLSPACKLSLPVDQTTARDDEAEKGIDRWMLMEEPDDNREEQCYYHTLRPDNDGLISYAIMNDDLEIAIKVTYSGQNLPSFTQWKCMRSGEYVLGLEPGTNEVGGRKIEREKNALRYIEPGEIKVNQFKIQFC